MNRGAILALTLGCFAVVMSATTVNVAITPIMRALDLSPHQAQLLSSVFLGTTVVLAPLSAWLADRWGGMQVFIAILLIYALASGLCVLYSNSFALLLVVRVIQGCCAGVVQPLALFLLLELTPLSHQGRSMSLFGFGVVLAPALGPGIAGWLVDHAGWQYVLALGAPPALLAVVLLRRAGKAGVTPQQPTIPRRLDLAGLVQLALLVAGFLLWPLVWEASHGLGFLTVGGWVWLGHVFLRQQRKAGSLLPLELLQQPEFKRVALITMAYGAGMYGSIYLIPLWLQDGLAVSATMTGNLLLVGGVALALSIMLAGRLVDRFSAKPILMLGMISFTLSCILFSLVGELAWITLGIVLSRIGLGSIIPSLYLSIARSVDEGDVRQAMAFTTLLRQGGGVIGVVVIGLLLSSLESVPLGEARPTQLYAGLFLLFAGAAMVARKLGN
tara:strand:- start:2059 stop:3387 length:1329 start_codon:yes stop_codon:yes gene_type:complete